MQALEHRAASHRDALACRQDARHVRLRRRANGRESAGDGIWRRLGLAKGATFRSSVHRTAARAICPQRSGLLWSRMDGASCSFAPLISFNGASSLGRAGTRKRDRQARPLRSAHPRRPRLCHPTRWRSCAMIVGASPLRQRPDWRGPGPRFSSSPFRKADRRRRHEQPSGKSGPCSRSATLFTRMSWPRCRAARARTRVFAEREDPSS